MQSLNSALVTSAATVFVGLLTFLGVLITNSKMGRNMERKLEVAQAVTDTKIDELTREVRLLNNLAIKVPVLEEQIRQINKNFCGIKKGVFYEQSV